ncbi:MAG: hypothetical protein ACPLRX_07725 [Candidatus Saccharicenans sp.]
MKSKPGQLSLTINPDKRSVSFLGKTGESNILKHKNCPACLSAVAKTAKQ